MSQEAPVRVGTHSGRLSKRGGLSLPQLGWVIALAQILLLVQAVVVWAWLGKWWPTELAIAGLIAFAAAGALITSRRARNRLGWYLLILPVAGTLALTLTEYVDVARLDHVSLPLVGVADWASNWIWTPSLMALGMLMIRFPDGRVPHRWRFADWLAIIGTILLTAGLAIITAEYAGPAFKPAHAMRLAGAGLLLPAGLGSLALATIAAAASLTERYRHGDKKMHQQLKWILLAAIVVTLALAYTSFVAAALHENLMYAAIPLDLALPLLPVAIGVAILRHRLFDIDLIISRTLVYVLLTAVLGGLYVGLLELLQRVFMLYTGQRSDAAIVITAFIVAGAFTPVQKWADKTIERRFGARDAAGVVEGISSTAESVVRIIDPHDFAHWLVDKLVSAFEAEGGVLYLHAHDRSQPFHACGHLAGQAAVEVAVSDDERELGRLVLGRRRGGLDYSNRDVEALKAATAALAKALVRAAALGHLATAPRTISAAPDGASQRVDGATSGGAPLRPQS